jgi:hypothetical protein
MPEHVSLAISLRNPLSLWDRDSPLERDAVKTYRIAHADDMGGLILARPFAFVRRNAFDTKEYFRLLEKRHSVAVDSQISDTRKNSYTFSNQTAT